MACKCDAPAALLLVLPYQNAILLHSDRHTSRSTFLLKRPWVFPQLRSFLEYKARESGIPVIVLVYTTQAGNAHAGILLIKRIDLGDPFLNVFLAGLREKPISFLPSTSEPKLLSINIL